MCCGLWELLVLSREVSPSCQDQEVGLPLEASVKPTGWPTTGALGRKLKLAVGTVPAAATAVTAWEAELAPAAFPAVRVTV